MTVVLPQPCQAHKLHAPKNLTVELHHVIPVAFQLHTPNPSPPFPGADPNGRGMLWDDRGEWLCPTGHRNTHHWIVQIMRQIARSGVDQPVPAAAIVRPKRPPREFAIAFQALLRYVSESGGSLLALTKVGEWGQS